MSTVNRQPRVFLISSLIALVCEGCRCRLSTGHNFEVTFSVQVKVSVVSKTFNSLNTHPLNSCTKLRVKVSVVTKTLISLKTLPMNSCTKFANKELVVSKTLK